MMRVGYQAEWVSYFAVNWILLCIADPPQQHHFTSIHPPDNEDMEMCVLGLEFHSFFQIGHYH
jgi:hypothetical protein